MNEYEKKVCNNGERLIPGVSHNIFEKIRHYSVYDYWKKIILYDGIEKETRVLDVGCGVGYGCKMIADISKKISVTGFDLSIDAIDYSKKKYNSDNISYVVGSLDEFINIDEEYDYIVSRHAIEHIMFGINKLFKLKWNKRIMFDVPYLEKQDDNYHHVLTKIDTKKILKDSGKTEDYIEFLYEDINGKIDKKKFKRTISIMAVCTKVGLPVRKIFPYPIQQWSE